MKLKLFVFTTLLAFFFILKTTAQNSTAPADNDFIDINLKVTDGSQNQDFKISTESKHSLPNKTNIAFKIHLDYLSTEDTTSYLGIQYEIFERLVDGSVGGTLKGLTAPVLIPPVRKKKSRVENKDKSFPFSIIDTTQIAANMRYKIVMNIAKFDSQDDYEDHKNNNNNTNYEIISLISFDINTYTANAERDPFLVTISPNPVTDYITIQHTKTSIEKSLLPKVTLEVRIFNDKGVKVSEYSLTDTENAPYTLDISQLQKGVYHCQLSNGTETQVKTIVKQ
ncbi:T9SS type A sorting domain-containing protein [uncultured Kordia sp.]|uniref:T9SS type A sorting domain-containing protein n=1 Tax=uncultured Kordia sp. TaxID=507699 RepID=UPI002621C693|nr:T9SS type A sorting domain-containing protein [uncultured Kordia sp.]